MFCLCEFQKVTLPIVLQDEWKLMVSIRTPILKKPYMYNEVHKLNLVSGILFSLPLHPTLLPPCTNQVLETGSKNITVTKNEFVPFKFFTQIKPFHRIWGDTESINSIFLIS